jgi:transcriptional regulator with XRE-family HTH domain
MPLDTEKLERLRKQLGLTQAEAARRAKLPGRAYWRDIVTGRRANITLAVLDNLAAALRCSPRGLIRRIPPSAPTAMSTGDPTAE